MTTEKEPKSLNRWLFEIRTVGKKKWLEMYEELVGKPVSSPIRFYRLLNLYGEDIVIESMLASMDTKFEDAGHALNYVSKIASTKWQMLRQQENDDAAYIAAIDNAKKATDLRNQELSKKLTKRRGRKS